MLAVAFLIGQASITITMCFIYKYVYYSRALVARSVFSIVARRNKRPLIIQQGFSP